MRTVQLKNYNIVIIKARGVGQRTTWAIRRPDGKHTGVYGQTMGRAKAFATALRYYRTMAQ